MKERRLIWQNMNDNKAVSVDLLELFSNEQDKFNKKLFARIKTVDSLEEIDTPEENVLYLVEENMEDAIGFTIADGSIGEIKLDDDLRAKLALLETAVMELEKI